MKPSSFEYHQPGTAIEAVELLHDLGDSARILAGGQSLVPMLALRLAMFEHLVDVGRVADLRGIERRNDVVRIGAGTTATEVGASAEIATSIPLLARATPLIGHFQIRNRGTIGGSIAHADPAAEYPAVALALDARLHVLGVDGGRDIPAADFFTGLWDTAMHDGELLTAISIPVWSGRCGFAIDEVARRHGDFALAGAAVAIGVDADDRIDRCGIALFGLAATPLRAELAEATIVGCSVDDVDIDEIAHAATDGLTDVIGDRQAPSDYRRSVATVTVARALRAARAAVAR